MTDLGMICDQEKHNIKSMLVGSDYLIEEVFLSVGVAGLTCLTLPSELTHTIQTLSAIVASYRVFSPLSVTVEAVLHDVVTFDSLKSSTSRTMTNIVGAGSKCILWLVWIVFSARAGYMGLPVGRVP